jgi:hypothetical protein
MKVTSNGSQKVSRGLALETFPSLVNKVLLGSLGAAKIDLTTLVKNRYFVKHYLLTVSLKVRYLHRHVHQLDKWPLQLHLAID